MKICKKCGGTEFYKFNCGVITCKKCHNERTRKSQEKYKEKYKIRAEKWREEFIKKNPNYSKEMSEKWRTNNLDKNREYHRLWEHKKRAKLRESGGILSKDIVQKLYKLQRGRCACCGIKLGKNFHLDHIIPLAKGGANTDSNVQLLTQKCNNQKHAKDPIDYMQSKGYLL